MLRRATLASSPRFFTSFTSSSRRSSESLGTLIRITFPSFWGFKPKSAAAMAFSMAPIWEREGPDHQEIRVRGGDVGDVLGGVGVP